VRATTTYCIEARVACPIPGGTFHVEVDGLDVTGPLAIPDTGDWQVWTTVGKSGVPLAAGAHQIKLAVDSSPGHDIAGNFNYLNIVAETPALAVTPAIRSAGAAAGTTSFGVANSGGGTLVYAAGESESWLTITGGGSGTDSGTIAVSYDANPGATARTGTVTVTAAGAIGSPATATVVQAGAEIHTYYRDADGDGYGDPNNTATGAGPPAGYVADHTDWNDHNASVHPGAPEIPDGVDNNGDGQIDEGARVGRTCFSLNQSIRCAGAGWSRTYVMDLTNSRNIAVQDGYKSYTVNYTLYYNIWTGIYLYDYDAGKFAAAISAMNLDL
jgi:hypothetical protein